MAALLEQCLMCLYMWCQCKQRKHPVTSTLPPLVLWSGIFGRWGGCSQDSSSGGCGIRRVIYSSHTHAHTPPSQAFHLDSHRLLLFRQYYWGERRRGRVMEAGCWGKSEKGAEKEIGQVIWVSFQFKITYWCASLYSITSLWGKSNMLQKLSLHLCNFIFFCQSL